MKKWVVFLVVSILLITCFISLSLAAPPIRHDARMVIHRTNIVLMEAQRAANREHRFFGLGKAIAHQREARDLFIQEHYRDAIFHSLRARALAVRVIKDNHGEFIPEMRREKWEERYAHEAPGDDELDLRITDRNVRDEDAVRFKLDFDIRE